MASRVLAQVIAAAGAVLFRAATQAWGQALANAQRSGVAQEAVKGATKAVGGMSAQEALQILHVEKGAPWGDVVKRYKHMFDQNEKHGSFYLVSKVVRAKEALEAEYEATGMKTPDAEDSSSNKPQQQISGDKKQE